MRGTGLVGSQLYALTATDPLTLAAASGVLFAAAIAATLIPAWRAASIDPVVRAAAPMMDGWRKSDARARRKVAGT